MQSAYKAELDRLVREGIITEVHEHTEWINSIVPVMNSSDIYKELHNVSAKMAGHLAFLARTLQPNQFEFTLKHSLHPIVQFNIPPHHCNPRQLHFARTNLTPD